MLWRNNSDSLFHNGFSEDPEIVPEERYPAYEFYLWDESNNLIVSGWEHIEDAEDALDELEGELSDAEREDVVPVIYERWELVDEIGILDPGDGKHWHGADLWPAQ